jgi:hypothetical protein
MNYLYQAHYEVGFSRHARPDLNPAAAIERGAARRLDAQLLRDAPLELDVHGPDVDWNRDGLISGAAVRAPLTWGAFKSCNTSEVGRTVLADHDVAAVSPVLLSEANARHALWLDGVAGCQEARKFGAVTRKPVCHGGWLALRRCAPWLL